MNQPNILFIMADQMNVRFTPLGGDKTAIMPNLLRLAQQGTIFRHAYCNNPVCAASRASMMSGRLVTQIGCGWENGAEFSSEIPTFAHMLRFAGYRTVLAGKMHFCGPDQLHGFEERVTTDIYPADFSWSTLRMDSPTPTHAFFRHHLFRDNIASEWNRMIDYDEHTHAEAKRVIFSHNKERPLFLTVSYTHPHNPYCAPQRYLDRYKDANIPMPDPCAFDSLDEYNRYVRWDNGFVEPLPDTTVSEARTAYYAMLSYVDDKIGELIETLRAGGMLDNTMIVFASDHGDLLGEKGMWDKRTFFEDATRVPLVFSGAGVKPNDIAAEVSLLDLFPTFIDVTQTDWSRRGLTGSSLAPALRGGGVDDKPVIIEYMLECAKYPLRAVVSGRKKYVYFPTQPKQDLFFDLTADPLECVNRIADPSCAAAIASLKTIALDGFDDALMMRRLEEGMHNRALINKSLLGKKVDWNYCPPYGADKRYTRG